jgi:hypothetical protein
MAAPLIVACACLLVIGYPIYRLVRYGGFRGALIGARIREKVGEVLGPQEKFFRSKLVVYRLAGSPGKDLALEFSVQSGESNLGFAVISHSEARRLAAMLREAIGAGGQQPERPA